MGCKWNACLSPPIPCSFHYRMALCTGVKVNCQNLSQGRGGPMPVTTFALCYLSDVCVGDVCRFFFSLVTIPQVSLGKHPKWSHGLNRASPEPLSQAECCDFPGWSVTLLRYVWMRAEELLLGLLGKRPSNPTGGYSVGLWGVTLPIRALET